ncbi:MAG: alpha-L-rhamnosidase-related protein, partial [Anaerolineae bacterium]
IVDCQLQSGQIPCIAPTSLWGYAWGSGVTWDAVLYELPWSIYRHTADATAIRRCFEAMNKYARFMRSTADHGIYRLGLGDWCAPAEAARLPEAILLTGCAYRIAALYSKCAALMGDAQDEGYAALLKDEIRAAFQREFGSLASASQTYYAMLLYYDLADDRQAALERLVSLVEKADGHLLGGIFCAKFILHVLSDNGRFDLAWRIATQETYPGWGYMTRVCAGTLGEDWLGGSSMNHHMFSPIGEWYYRALAGFEIDEQQPGFKHILLQPHIPADLGHFKAWQQTPYGRLETSWDAGKLYLTIPAGTTAAFTYQGTTKELGAGSYEFAR